MKNLIRSFLHVTVLLLLCLPLQAAETLSPGDAIDFEPLAFYPQRWKDNKVDMTMYPWVGEQVVFLTMSPDFDGEVMAGLLERLDGGWLLYADLTGKKPRLTRQVAGKPTLAAISEFKLTCGYGCGYVGATGIELGAFYRSDYRNIQANPNAVPDYYFYEMGRNYFTFGEKHSLFTTGFAVFMRYVCVDRLKLKTDDQTRATIEAAEALYAKGNMPFLKAFTVVDGLHEKQNRLSTSPSDQPVMYASAMLMLRRELGGEAWLKKYYRYLDRCPRVRIPNVKKQPLEAKQAGLRQALNWYVAASCAAGKDLSPIFVDRWRMPMSEQVRQVVTKVSWDSQNPDPTAIIKQLQDQAQEPVE